MHIINISNYINAQDYNYFHEENLPYVKVEPTKHCCENNLHVEINCSNPFMIEDMNPFAVEDV